MRERLRQVPAAIRERLPQIGHIEKSGKVVIEPRPTRIGQPEHTAVTVDPKNQTASADIQKQSGIYGGVVIDFKTRRIEAKGGFEYKGLGVDVKGSVDVKNRTAKGEGRVNKKHVSGRGEVLVVFKPKREPRTLAA